MSRRLLSLGVAALVFVPGAVFAQGFGVGVRGGTIGIGAEGAVGLGDNLVVRGGLGLMPLEVDASSFWDPGQDVTANLELPKTWYNIGADLYLGGSSAWAPGCSSSPTIPP